MEPVIQVKDLTKTIRRKKIIDSISFDCRAGEVFGFLGPDGAGKTTTIKMMLGLCSYDKGEILLNGAEVSRAMEAALLHVGGIVESPELYPFLSGRQNLRQFARMRGKPEEARIGEALALCGLTREADEKVKRYSLGMRQRLGLAQALLHRPNILLLDEPTNGLDPAGIRDLRDIAKRLAHQENACVLISSHLMSEMELLCDRVCILDRGRIVQIKNLNELMDGMPSNGRMAFRFVVSPIQTAKKLVVKAGFGTVLDVTPEHIDIQLTSDELIVLNRVFIENGVALHTVAPVRGGSHLEDVFLAMTGEEDGDA